MTLNIYLFTTLVTAIKKLLLLTTNVLISITGFVYKINKNPLFGTISFYCICAI